MRRFYLLFFIDITTREVFFAGITANPTGPWTTQAVGILAGATALAYVLTGTIPETDDAPATVGVSYGVGAAVTYLGQLLLGIAAVRTEALPGRLRWAPIGVVILQFPVFIAAGAIGDGIGDETVTDGLGMLLTGALWATSSVAVWTTGGKPANEPTPAALPAS